MQAIAKMQQAVAAGKDQPYAFGPPSPEKPSYELFAELLLKDNQPAQAREAFAAALQRAPWRTHSLFGQARAQRAMGDKAAATGTYGELSQIWKIADANYPPAKETRSSPSIPSPMH